MDDEALGCGGVISRHVADGDEVYVCFVAHRIYDHIFDSEKNKIEKQHSQNARQVLGYNGAVYLNLNDEKLDICLQDIIIPLENYVNKIKPDIVYCPFYGDNNQDHRAVYQAARVVMRPVSTDYIKTVLLYETPSSSEQSPPTIKDVFMPNHYVNIESYLEKKISAFACYETEARTFPHPRSEQALRALAMKRGVEIGYKYAEAFMLVRNKY